VLPTSLAGSKNKMKIHHNVEIKNGREKTSRSQTENNPKHWWNPETTNNK